MPILFICEKILLFNKPESIFSFPQRRKIEIKNYLLLEEIRAAKKIVVQVKDEKLPANKNVILWGKVNRMLSISHKDQ